MKLIFLSIGVLLTSIVYAQTSIVTFTISNAGIDVTGSIRVKHLDFAIDEQNIDRSNITAVAAASTINTGIEIRDKHLGRADYFDVRNYPDIALQSIRFKRTNKKKVLGLFTLTIKDQTRYVQIPIEITKSKTATVYNGTFELNRLDFKLGEKSVVLDETVKVNVTISTSSPQDPT